MDPVFAVQEDKARSYFTVENMVRLDLIDTILSGRMRDLILSIVPDPVLYHCHAYEIAANSTTSHIFNEALAGWHRDPDSEYFAEDPTHTSIFVYLTDVGPEDGAFEFSPSYPESWVRSKNPAISMMGPTGMSFAWNRAYYHRASPNRGPRRRRLLKLSIQPNAFPSAHLSNANFQAARKALLPGDHFLDLLFGRYQGETAPLMPVPQVVPAKAIPPTGMIGIPDSQLAAAQVREKARQAKRWLKRQIRGDQQVVAAYD